MHYEQTKAASRSSNNYNYGTAGAASLGPPGTKGTQVRKVADGKK